MVGTMVGRMVGTLIRIALGLAATTVIATGCHVSSVSTDAYVYPDAGAPELGEASEAGDAIDAGDAGNASDAGDLGDAGDAPPPQCDLLRQDCATGKSCYPADGLPGATSCEVTGSAPPLTFCVSSVECDAREVCVYVAESDVNMCALLCDPAAAASGCQGASTCRPIAGYEVGFCTP